MSDAMRGVVGIVADDLTGVLDTAAPFAREEAPVAIWREVARVRTDASWALDAATRGGDEASAIRAAERAAPLWHGAAVAYRKIDSLLRGHVAAEIAASARAGRFASVVIAPAFPAQGRVMRDGRQHVRRSMGWQEVAGDLARDLAAQGLTVRLARDAGAIRGAGAFLCDAEHEADLAAIAAAGNRLAAPLLWCGSAGLARALGAGAVRPMDLPRGPVLGIIGSRRATTLAEIQRLHAADPSAVLEIGSPDDIARHAQAAELLLASGRSVVLALRLPPLEQTRAALVLRTLASAAASLQPAALFASGGDTLAALADAAGAERLDVQGEIAPGVPLSRFGGGRIDGVPVVSKSGAFASAKVLAGLFAAAREKNHVHA